MQPNVDHNDALNMLNQLKKKAENLNLQIDYCLEHHSEYCRTGSIFEKNITFGKLLEAMKNSEKITVALREAPFVLGIPEHESDTIKYIKDVFPASFGYTENGFFYMKIPRIPSIKSNPNDVKYFRDSVYSIITNAFSEGLLERHLFDKVVLVYYNRYDNETAKRKWSDNDNLEHRALTNLLAAFFLFDDNPECCDCFVCSDYGKENCTEIYIVPKEKYVKFWEMKENHKLESMNLSPKYPAD